MAISTNFHHLLVKSTSFTDGVRTPVDNIWAQIGYDIFSHFKTVMVLKQQMHVVDHVWMEMLERVRYSNITCQDLEQFQQLTLTNSKCIILDFCALPWNHAVLVTSRHTVRIAWNKAMIYKISRNLKRCVLVSPAVEYIGKTKRGLTRTEQRNSAKQK